MSVRRLILMSIGLALSQASLFVVRPIASYRLLELGLSASVVGLVTATYALSPLFLAMWAGRVAAGRRAEHLAVAGSILLFLGCVGIAFMHDAVQAVVASVLLGMGNLGQMIAWQSLVTRESTVDEYDRNFGWYTSGGSLGQLSGPVIGTAVMASFPSVLTGTTWAALAGGGLALVGVVLSVPLLFGIKSRPIPEQPATSAQLTARAVLAHPGAKASIYVSLMVLSTVDLLSVYLPVLGEAIGIAPTMVGVLLGVRATFSLVSRLFLGALSVRHSRRALLMSTTGVAAVMVGVVTLTSNEVLLLPLMALLGLGMGIGQPLTMSWTVMMVPPYARSTALSLRLVGNRLGQVVVPSIAAGVTSFAGAVGVFWMLSAFLASAFGVAARRPAPAQVPPASD